MLDPAQALAAAHRPVAAIGRPRPQRVLVVGGGGALGAAVLEALLAEPRCSAVGVLADAALNPALRRLRPLRDDAPALAAFGADAALIVFDRERHANGRDAAFLRPQPADLPRWGQRLHAAGVRCLVVVVPHRAARLPAALRHGLAGLDEAALAAQGFAQLVFMRMADSGSAARLPGWRAAPQRLAGWMLGQLQWMVPQAEQPVRHLTVARAAARLPGLLAEAGAAPATRVLPPEWLWHAAQAGAAGLDPVLRAWLAGQPPPQRHDRRRW